MMIMMMNMGSAVVVEHTQGKIILIVVATEKKQKQNQPTTNIVRVANRQLIECPQKEAGMNRIIALDDVK